MNNLLNSIKLIEPYFTTQLAERYSGEINNITRQQEELLSSLLKTTNSKNYEDLEEIDILETLEFLHKTHLFYLNKILPEIEQRFTEIKTIQATSSADFLFNIFTNFKSKLIEHIQEEERDVFPYIRKLLNELTPVQKRCTMKDFVHQHDQVPEVIFTAIINGVKLLIKKEPKNTLLHLLSSKLELFERDLKIHTMIEDHVLLPQILKLEQQKK
jgi:regulator of cell morphogenesis and NO signaling